MGISSSRPDLNLRSDQFPWETLVHPADQPEKKRALLDPLAKAAVERLMRDLEALFPPKLGESSIDQPKEERDERVGARLCEFMKGGACKESFTAFVDCLDVAERPAICRESISKLIKCVDAHSDYYKPIIKLVESNLEQIGKEGDEIARKHANKWLRRFW